MKKFIPITIVLALIVGAIALFPAFSADTDFIVEDSVLLKYEGSDQSVTVPSSVSVIADEAFMNNTAVKSVKLPSSVLSIGNMAFKGCTSLATVSGGENILYVGALAFVDTPYLEKSTSEFLTLGGALICYNGTSKDVVLPEYIATISPYAFLRNQNINSFYADENLTTIGEGAFYECTNLSDVSVTNMVSYIDADAFCETAWQNSQPDFAVLGDSILVAYNGDESVLSVPTGVRQIAPNAFYENSHIKNVELPSTVFAVGERAFMNCSELATVELNTGLVMIADEAFANCTNLVDVTTPVTLSRLGDGAFINCSKLSKAIVLGNNLSIGRGAFANCNSLNVALLSNGVSALCDDAFSNNKKLKAVSVPEQVTSLTTNVFNNCPSLTVVCQKNSFADDALSGKVSVSHNRGDANLDGTISIMDTTALQLHIAGVLQLPDANLPFMDADFDGGISILDATYVQLVIAKLL